MDPRLAGIDRRLGEVARILAVTGGKGGIGKSTVASILALVLAEGGMRTGLLDLDLTGPSDHVILGVDGQVPTEGFGLEPPLVHGTRFMSISYFLGQHSAPLRGIDVTNAIMELLAVTRWGALDVLVIDMPPGLGDVSLDLVRWLRRAEYLVVAGRSRVVLETVRRMLRFLTDLRLPIAGVVENMAHEQTEVVEQLARRFGVPFLGALPFDADFEEANGDVSRLPRTVLAGAVREVRDRLFRPDPGSESG